MCYLKTRRQQHCATQMLKIDMGLCPEPIHRLFTKRNELSTRNTSQSELSNYQLPPCRLEMTKCCFQTSRVKVWHNVPDALRTCETAAQFKDVIKLLAGG